MPVPKKKYNSKSFKNRTTKSHQKQALQPGASYEVSSLNERQSSLPSNSTQEQKLQPDGSFQANSPRERQSGPSKSKDTTSNNFSPPIVSCDEENFEFSESKTIDLKNTTSPLKVRRVGESSFDEKEVTKRSFVEGGHVVGKWQNNRLIEVESCEFIHPYSNKTVYIRKQRAGYLFTFDEEDFIARARFDKLDELDFTELHINEAFLKKIVITKIITDKLLNDRDAASKQFTQLLLEKFSRTADNFEYAEDLFQLSEGLKYWKKSSNNMSILNNIVNHQSISSGTKYGCQQLRKREIALALKRRNVPQVTQFYKIDFFKILQQICKDGVNNHRRAIASSVAFSLMADRLESLNERSILSIGIKDMELFADLANMMDEEPFRDIVSNSWYTFLNAVEEINRFLLTSYTEDVSLQMFGPLTHPIFFYLCKSYQELVKEICSKANIAASDLVKNQKTKWSLLKDMNTFSPLPLNYSLVQEYYFILKLMKHYQPGYYNNTTKFDYKPKLLQNSKENTFLQRIKKTFSRYNDNNEIPAISQERLVWIYILDDAIADLILKEELKLFLPLYEGYKYFIEHAVNDNYESFRIVMHNTVRFVAQTSPYLSKIDGEIDQNILIKQIESINRNISENCLTDFRDLIDIYSEYWKYRDTIIDKFPKKFSGKTFTLNMEKIHEKLLCIVQKAVNKHVQPQAVIRYFRSFNEFLADLSSLEFNNWFIKYNSDFDANALIDQKVLKLVDNKLATGDKRSYLIIDPDKFVEALGKRNIPQHYLIQVIEILLSIVENCLSINWADSDTQLIATAELLSAIRSSFLYLKEQPDYLSFDTFKDESTNPFASVVEKSSNFEDFEKRIRIIKESFWYIRKQDELDINEALELYRDLNNKNSLEIEIEIEIEILGSCYNKYLEKFNYYIGETLNMNLNHEGKIKFIVQAVKAESKPRKTNKWTTKFKKETIPYLLAGLAAVWSIQESKDISSTGKSLKPHCIQILCILRLLSVDNETQGVEKHLAQVLTGQGKSLVLGFLSSLLALMGHKVRTVCYSEYLATRDNREFADFFTKFGINDKITYGTFENMANEFLEPKVNGRRQCLRELIKNRILHHNTEQAGNIKAEDINNTILLIDEVDVFFSDQFYGNQYSAGSRINMSALVSIQEKIWELVKDNNNINNVIFQKIDDFINSEIQKNNQQFREFNVFVSKPGNYYLLNDDDDVLRKIEYTNQFFYKEHIDKMIDVAINVAKRNNRDCFSNWFKINDKGIISLLSRGEYSTLSIISYYNVFNYFRLKEVDYNHKWYQNYGYFQVPCGRISYARLPEKHPLILGVSGTLAGLNDHEASAVKESYKINVNSLIPSYFGQSNLKFDADSNCVSENSEPEWLNLIFKHANSKINLGLSVLIFFDTEHEIDKFKEKFMAKFDRLHILTENTDELTKKKYIDEAGITKVVTLATRGMGRGVDFKSSVAVERNGGVHVIQTFFSLDIKEETQIKGRTARKDNKGSYELILCKQHLIRDGFIKKETAIVSYRSLSIRREIKIKEKGSLIEKKIKESEDNHKTTMSFLESFFKV